MIRNRTVRKIKVAFKSNQAGAKFKCRLDRKKFKKCKSPSFLKRVKPGKPAVAKFRVKRKK